jgi:single-strand DNA-binding protein
MARSLNKVELIGNLTRDPELRYTPQGTAVCTFGIATNRYWTTEGGEKKEDVEFHRIVAWQKLAELCGQLLTKGRKIYVEGRLQTRRWTSQDGQERTTTEVVINDMIILDSRGVAPQGEVTDFDIPDEGVGEEPPVVGENKQVSSKSKASDEPIKSDTSSKIKTKAKTSEVDDEPKADDDIPF